MWVPFLDHSPTIVPILVLPAGCFCFSHLRPAPPPHRATWLAPTSRDPVIKTHAGAHVFKRRGHVGLQPSALRQLRCRCLASPRRTVAAGATTSSEYQASWVYAYTIPPAPCWTKAVCSLQFCRWFGRRRSQQVDAARRPRCSIPAGRRAPRYCISTCWLGRLPSRRTLARPVCCC